MNFLDTYDIGRAPTPQPDQNTNQPSLNEEVNQVIGQLGRFWGGFRKQSQQVFEVAKKDFGDVVVQAQKEITKLTGAESSEASASTSASTSESAAATASDSTSRDITQSTTPVSGESSKDVPPSTSDAPTPEPAAPSDSIPASTSSTQSLFSRLQSALPPNIVSTVQTHIPESLRHASENIDVNQIRSNLLSEFQRVQGITRAQAEEYAHKSEALLREAVKEASEAFSNAVKIIPPTTEGDASGLVWDGSDMWMLPTDASQSSSGKDKAEESSKQDTQNAVASRALALLQRLRTDPTIIQHDPQSDEATKDQYQKWFQEEIESKGGISSPEVSEKIDGLLKDETSLYELYTSLVPSSLSKEEFWSRYFFREHQIKQEEERRKALIRATTESEDEFSWEDDDEESSAASPTSATAPTLKEKEKDTLSPDAAREISASRSQRVGSEDSFDLVSSRGASVVGDTKPQPVESTDDDSDWE